MSKDGDVIEIVENEDLIFDDPVSQRAYAFVHLAKFAEVSTDETAKDLTYAMMRKVCASIKTTQTADLKVIEGRKT